jgi:hypothetical protein
MKDLSIDDLIEAVEALVFIRNDRFFLFPPALLEQLKKNTKLGDNKRTGTTINGVTEGDLGIGIGREGQAV